jgi:prevent-host-death family protein
VDLPEPDKPEKTTNESLGKETSMFLRLFSLAPLIIIFFSICVIFDILSNIRKDNYINAQIKRFRINVHYSYKFCTFYIYVLYIFLYNVIEVIIMCYVTATELKNNLSLYLEKADVEDVYVTKNNKVVCVLISPQLKALYDAERMIAGLEIPEEAKKKEYKELIGEAIEEKCGY